MATAIRLRPRLRCRERLSRFSSIRIGGAVEAVVSLSSSEVFGDVLDMYHRGEIPGPLAFVGRGSNILFPDAGLGGTLVRFEHGDGGSGSRWHSDGRVDVDAGLSLPALARDAARRGVAGFEFLSGIPGTVGGAAVMNAGAGSRQWSDLCESLVVATGTGRSDILLPQDLKYGYRTSALLEISSKGDPATSQRHILEKSVVLSARLRGELADPAECQAKLVSHLDYRRSTQPLDEPSLGSVFRNPSGGPPGYSAGRLIEECGMKGRSVGGVMVSPRHANFFVNTGGGKASEFLELMATVAEAVLRQWGVILEPEVRVWNA